MNFVKISDLMFNGGEGCTILYDRPEQDYITIKSVYDTGAGTNWTSFYYKDVYLGGYYGHLVVGVLNDILESLRGRGRWEHWSPWSGSTYAPFTPEEERVIKRLGLWVF